MPCRECDDHRRGCLGWINLRRSGERQPDTVLEINLSDATRNAMRREDGYENIVFLLAGKLKEIFGMTPRTMPSKVVQVTDLPHTPEHEIRIRLPCELMLEYPSGGISKTEAEKFAARVHREVLQILTSS